MWLLINLKNGEVLLINKLPNVSERVYCDNLHLLEKPFRPKLLWSINCLC